MQWIDIVILIIIAISAILSIIRGFVKEVLSLVAWALAIWVAVRFTDPLSAAFEPLLNVPSARRVAAFATLFFSTLISVAIVNFLIGKIIHSTGLSGTDRMLGILFGLARGIAIVWVIVIAAGFTRLPQDPWWRDSQFLPHFEALALWSLQYFPANLELQKKISYQHTPVEQPLHPMLPAVEAMIKGPGASAPSAGGSRETSLAEKGASREEKNASPPRTRAEKSNDASPPTRRNGASERVAAPEPWGGSQR